MKLFRPRRKAVGRIPAAVVPASPSVRINVVGSPIPGHLHIKKDHVRLRIFFKFQRNRPRRSRPVNDILICEHTQIPVRTHQTVIPGKPHAALRKAVEFHGMSLIRILPVCIFITLIYNNRIRLKVHTLRKRFHILLHGGNKKLHFHVHCFLFPDALRFFFP